MHAEMVMHEHAIDIGGAWRSYSRDSSCADPVSVDTCAVQREAHPPASPPADLARLTCQQDLRSFNASRGWLGAPTHYSGQRDVGTGVIHHHRAAEALFAGFYIITPHRHFTVLQRANAGEATALTRLPRVCVATSGAQAGS